LKFFFFLFFFLIVKIDHAPREFGEHAIIKSFHNTYLTTNEMGILQATLGNFFVGVWRITAISKNKSVGNF
jgi:hypothetical protein